MEAASTPPAEETPHTSFLEKLRGYALQVEEHIHPSEVLDILSAVVSLLGFHEIPVPEPAKDQAPSTASEDQLRAQNAELEARIAQLEGASTPAPPAEPVAPPTPPPGPFAPSDPTAPSGEPPTPPPSVP